MHLRQGEDKYRAKTASGDLSAFCRGIWRSTYMETERTLHSLDSGMTARVRKLNNEGAMRRRLQDIGLIEGTDVVCLQRSPSGDPIAYLIRGAVIALREEDSRRVIVE